MTDDALRALKALLLEVDNRSAQMLRTKLVNLSELAGGEPHSWAREVVVHSLSAPGADGGPAVELRRRLLLEICIARGLQDTDVAREIDDGGLDVEELTGPVRQSEPDLWEAVAGEESQLEQAARAPVAQQSVSAPKPWRARLRQWFRELMARMFAKQDADTGDPSSGVDEVLSNARASSPGVLDIGRLVEALEQNLLEKAVLPALRTGVTAQRGILRSTQLPIREATGLGQLADLRSVVATEGRDRLARLVGTLTTGCIGVAGPRGAGKSTLLSALEQGIIPPGDSPFRYRCLVSAPTRYDAREFLLHLTRRLCEEVLRSHRVWVSESSGQLESRGLKERLTGLGWALIGGLVLLSAGLTLHASRDWWAAAGGVLMGLGALLAAVVFVSPSYRRFVGTSFVAFLISGALGVAGFALLTQSWLRIAVDPELAWAWGALYVALIGVCLRVDSWLSRVRGVSRTAEARGRDPVSIALELRESTRYQLSFSRSTNASVSLDLKPVGGGLGVTRGVTRNPLPQSLPEVVENFRVFVRKLSSEAERTLIVVDELDKMASPEETGLFLNDIKGVFGLENSVFVLSVSEDALASFERRGLPARDAIDSSMDDVIRIEPLSLSASIDLLSQRVPRVPIPFWALCFALSGGLARDLIRSARSLFDMADGKVVALAAASSHLVRADVRARGLGTVAGFGACAHPGTAAAGAAWALRLARLEDVADLRGDVLDVPFAILTAQEKTADAAESAARLCCQAYLGATIADVFSDRDYDEFEAAIAARSPRCLDQFAHARYLLALSPHASWLAIDAYRQQWDLHAWPSPIHPSVGDDPSAGTPAAGTDGRSFEHGPQS